MQHPQNAATFTTISAALGGVLKALSVKPILMTISLGSIGEVVVYATASASVGYVVKRLLDKVYYRFFSKETKSSTGKSE
jgi:hypothetical protein